MISYFIEGELIAVKRRFLPNIIKNQLFIKRTFSEIAFLLFSPFVQWSNFVFLLVSTKKQHFKSYLLNISFEQLLLLHPWALDIINLVYFSALQSFYWFAISKAIRSYSFFVVIFFRLAKMQLDCWWWDDAVFFSMETLFAIS